MRSKKPPIRLTTRVGGTTADLSALRQAASEEYGCDLTVESVWVGPDSTTVTFSEKSHRARRSRYVVSDERPYKNRVQWLVQDSGLPMEEIALAESAFSRGLTVVPRPGWRSVVGLPARFPITFLLTSLAVTSLAIFALGWWDIAVAATCLGWMATAIALDSADAIRKHTRTSGASDEWSTTVSTVANAKQMLTPKQFDEVEKMLQAAYPEAVQLDRQRAVKGDKDRIRELAGAVDAHRYGILEVISSRIIENEKNRLALTTTSQGQDPSRNVWTPDGSTQPEAPEPKDAR